MKFWVFLFLCIINSTFYVLADDGEIDEIKVIVNDQILLNSDIDNIMFMLEKEGKNVITPLKSNFLKERVIEKLIVNNLILQQANKMNISITKKQINDVIKNIAFKKNMSVNEFKNQIILNDNISYENYLKNIENMLKTKLVQNYELHKRIHIPEKKVNFVFKKIINKNKTLKKINLNYIFLPFLKKKSDIFFTNKKKLSEEIFKKLNSGYSFDKLCNESKIYNSDLLFKKNFWIKLNTLQKNFSKTLEIFKKKQVLGPFLKNNGFYIFQVDDILNNQENILTEFYIQHCLIKNSIILNDVEIKNNTFNIYNNIKNRVYSFDYAVKKFSDDIDSSNKQGDLGWISNDSLDTNFQKELLLLKENEISQPIKSQMGWHIIRLLKKRKIDQFYNLQKHQSYDFILHRKMFLEKYNWIQDLKNSSYIKIIQP
ncbi:peptidylprolyl isomerase [Buchnera aphidicola (Diuraphis noxia)]|uniref:Peptidylprolyl isomerase n=1 Tax=Buchnera aphidicola subsp. Diuraphis noxia TaxID=118101 RepID=A0A1B2H9C4_BUCDN|nr:peptidylprolyl isomerase [Buchnera aphidicola (Diuraphis noxia)]